MASNNGNRISSRTLNKYQNTFNTQKLQRNESIEINKYKTKKSPKRKDYLDAFNVVDDDERANKCTDNSW